MPSKPQGYSKRNEQDLSPYWVDVQADWSLCWSHRSCCRFCHAVAQMCYFLCYGHLLDAQKYLYHTISVRNMKTVNTLSGSIYNFLLQVYPNERHGIKNHEANEHYKTMVLNFLQNNL